MEDNKYKRLRAVCDFLLEENNFGVRIPETNEMLNNLGFDKLLEVMKEQEDFNAEPHLVMLDIIDRTGILELNNYERRALDNARNSSDIIMPTNQCYDIFIDKYIYPKKNANIYNFESLLDNYNIRNKNITKEQSEKENNILKYIYSEGRMQGYKLVKLDNEILNQSEVSMSDIQNPVAIDFRTKTLYLMESDANNRYFLSMPTTDRLFYDSYTYHISAFIYSMVIQHLNDEDDIFFKAVSNKIELGATIMLIFLELERRFYKDKTIREYLKPLVEINLIVTNNYIVGRINNDHLYVVYKCDGLLLVEEKYISQVLFDKGVSMNEDGVLVTYSNNKPLWDIVFPIYKPKKSYNFISDSNRGK